MSAPTISRQGQTRTDAHKCGALPGTNSPAAKHVPTPTRLAPQVPNIPADHVFHDTQGRFVGGDSTSSSGQAVLDTQLPRAAAGSTSPDGHAAADAQPRLAVRGSILRDGLLALLADTVDDLERTRIANENRYRQLTRTDADEDGEVRGLGLDATVPEVRRAGELVAGLAALEHQAVLAMQRQVRKNPMWIRYGVHAKGIGEKQFARLLSAVGDPYWNDLHDRPRTVSELWAYAGYHVITSGSGHLVLGAQSVNAAAGATLVHPAGQKPRDTQLCPAGGVAARRTKGQPLNWSATAKMRAYLVAESCMKTGDVYRVTYDGARQKYADATHSTVCVRCGPAGKPALAGTPLSLGHQNARALRIVAKTILKDMWTAAKAIHEGNTP